MRKTRLAIVCLEGLDNFLQWAEPLNEHYEVKIFIIRNENDVIRAVGFADVIWCEWANESAIAVTKYLETTKNKNDKKVILRLHSYEALVNYPASIKWDYVNHIVYVAEHVVEIVNTYHNDLNINNRHDYTVVPNGVDIEKIDLNKPGNGKNICSVGAISHKKNPSMMLQIFANLLERDSGYTLHVAGEYQESRYEIYMNHMVRELDLTGKIIMYGHVKDMNKFYSDKDFILHTSVHEGHCVSIIEAMARGITPVIHNFYGADKQYESNMLFNDVYGAVNRIVNLQRMGIYHRQYITDKGWTLQDQVSKFINIIETVTGHIVAGDGA